jgi:hypothetical protein
MGFEYIPAQDIGQISPTIGPCSWPGRRAAGTFAGKLQAKVEQVDASGQCN